MTNVLRAHKHFDENFTPYPAFNVNVNLERLYEDARSTVFDGLLNLDIDEACATIERGAVERGEGEQSIFVGADEGTAEKPVLTLIAGMSYTDVEVLVDPTMFDRTNPNHEELLQRCVRLVAAINQSPSEEDAGNPVYEQVECLRWAEHVQPEEMIARWARLAEIWADASKPA